MRANQNIKISWSSKGKFICCYLMYCSLLISHLRVDVVCCDIQQEMSPKGNYFDFYYFEGSSSFFVLKWAYLGLKLQLSIRSVQSLVDHCLLQLSFHLCCFKFTLPSKKLIS